MITRLYFLFKCLSVSIVILMVFPCIVSAEGPEISFEPRHFLDPLHTAPYQELVVTLTISNSGDENLNIYSVTATDSSGPPLWISIGSYSSVINTSSFDEVDITLNAGGILGDSDPASYDAIITITHDAPSATDNVQVSLTVASDFNMPEEAILNTTCKQLMVYNTGRLGGGNDDYSMNIPDDCDSVDTPPNALMYLNHASPLIAWHDGEQVRAYTTLFSQNFTEDGTFRPQSDLNFYEGLGQVGIGSLDMMVCTLTTSDSLFGVIIHLFAPTDGVNSFIIGHYEFLNWNPVKGANEVYLGIIADWDIPSDNAVDNGSGFDALAKTMWQFGADYDTLEQDNMEACGGVGMAETDRLGGVAMLYGGSGDLKNAWAEPNEPYLLGSGFDKDYLYDRMSTLAGYNPYTDDSLVNIHTGMTFEMVDFTAKAAYKYVVAFITTNQGEMDYLHQFVDAERWAYEQGIIPMFGVPQPGDANWDYQVNVGDAVYLISYIFKGGPAPSSGLCGGDANGDCACNVGDAVFVISYVFKGGPAPPDYWDWKFQCLWFQ